MELEIESIRPGHCCDKHRTKILKRGMITIDYKQTIVLFTFQSTSITDFYDHPSFSFGYRKCYMFWKVWTRRFLVRRHTASILHTTHEFLNSVWTKNRVYDGWNLSKIQQTWKTMNFFCSVNQFLVLFIRISAKIENDDLFLPGQSIFVVIYFCQCTTCMC